MLSKKDVEELKQARTDKDLKKIFKEIASRNPDEFFPTKELRELGYLRKQCETCNTFFWTTHENRKVCGDPSCSGGFQVVIDNPSKVKLSYIGVWKKIVEILEPRGYKPIKRYPCVARWNPTSEFTIASISAFQPYVITGEVEPPAKKLLIPQFCLRFNDIENVGITGSHCTGFVMIGQHVFLTPEEWNQGQLFIDMHDFITEGIGLSKDEITIHEDSWAGGGSFGCSLEFFSRGVELFNQVYTMFEQTRDGPKELKLKILDMGLGQERVAWFSQGTPNMYEAVFPKVLSKLREITGIELDLNLYNEFSKYSAYLNIDEVDDMDEAWERVAKELDISVSKLKEKILPMTAIYSIAEHARSLLFAINDGKLPSNVGGGYNLRVIFRRAMNFIDKFGWNINLGDVCAWHAEELKELFPEVSENLNEIKEILNVEKEKYYSSKKQASKILKKFMKQGKITTDILIELYDSHGINPDLVRETAKNYGIEVKVPDNFYSLIVERHEKSEEILATEKEVDIDLSGVPETKSLYFDDYTRISNKAIVLKIVGRMVVLDQSVAYPTSGGQLHDIGTINGQRFSEVFKHGGHVIHVLDEPPKFKENEEVEVIVDKEWRTQLTQHHTATHIVNAAARKVLGKHVNQAGARKTFEYSHLDITHYAQIPKEKLKKIEDIANEIVKKAIKINLSFMPRHEAEQKYGMTIYQGGAVPGRVIRIVEIPGIDVEACGGTHLNNTSEAGRIKITKSQKIQDGIIRLTFTAGKATEILEKAQKKILKELSQLFQVDQEHVVGRVKELLNKWKNLNKSLQTGKFNENDLKLESLEKYKGDILTELNSLLKVKHEDIPKKVRKLYNEWNEAKGKLNRMKMLLSDSFIQQLIDKAEDFKGYKLIITILDDLTQKDLKNFSVKVIKKSDDLITIFTDKANTGILIMGMLGTKPAKEKIFHMGNFIKKILEKFEGKGGGGIDYGQGLITDESVDIKEIFEEIKKQLHSL